MLKLVTTPVVKIASVAVKLARLLIYPPVITALPDDTLVKAAPFTVKLVNAPVLGTVLPIGVPLIATACRLPAMPTPPNTCSAPEYWSTLAVLAKMI